MTQSNHSPPLKKLLCQLFMSTQNDFWVTIHAVTQRTFFTALGFVFILALGVITAVTFANSPTQQFIHTQNPFGVVEAYESPADADALGASWTRILFRWNDIQPENSDQWLEPLVSEAQINAEIAANREVVGLIIGMPEWAQDENGLPKGLWLPHTDPNNMWATFVRQTVTKYEGRITHWVIWNEPDVWDKESFGHTWEGNVTEFAQLHRIAYHTAKEVTADNIIHLSAFTYYWDSIYGREQYLKRLLEEFDKDPLAPENNYYFDVATAHLYYNPTDIDKILQDWQEILAERDLQQRFWLIETNAPPSNDLKYPVIDPRFNVTEAEQAAFLPQIMAVALVNNVERMGVYKLKDNPVETAAEDEPFGLIRKDGSRRPAFDAYRLAMLRMRGAESAVRDRWDDIGQITLIQYGQQTTVMFARSPSFQIAAVEAFSDTATLIDNSGAAQLVTAEDGVFNIQLSGARCGELRDEYCMIGGDVVYLIQSTLPTPTATIPPTATIDPALITATPSPIASPTDPAVATVVLVTETPDAVTTVLPTATTFLVTPTSGPPQATATALPTATDIPPTATPEPTPTTILVTSTGTPLVSIPTLDPNATMVVATSMPGSGGLGGDTATPPLVTPTAVTEPESTSTTESVEPTATVALVTPTAVVESDITPTTETIEPTATEETVSITATAEPSPLPTLEVVTATPVSADSAPTVEPAASPYPSADNTPNAPIIPSITTLAQPAAIGLIDIVLIGASIIGILFALWVIMGKRDAHDDNQD